MTKLRNLKTFVTLPIVTLKHGVITTPGYHAETECYAQFDAELMEGFELDPSRAELVAALRQLWRPFEEFRFSSPTDRGALLAAIIGAVARAGMALAPGVGVDAPCPSSGKTLLAQAVGTIGLGKRAPVTAFSGDDDEELKKVLIANSLAGVDFLLLDNVVGLYGSSVMASLMTSGALADRVLGASRRFEGEVRPTILITSNNCTLSRDLTSRFIRVRLDTGVEQPQALSFDFCPIERALSERTEIVRAICVVYQGFFAAGAPRIGRGDVRFPEWSRLVRQCVLWCGASSLTQEGRQRLNEGEEELRPEDGLPSLAEEAGIGLVGDPAWQILEAAGRTDPESEGLGMLLSGLREIFGGERFYVKEVVAVVEGLCDEAAEWVKDGLELLLPARAPLTVKSVASIFRYRVDRIGEGLVMRRYAGAHKTSVYSIQTA